LVIGITWPPETFLRRKLEGLARLGLHVTVAASKHRRMSTADEVGVQVFDLTGQWTQAIAAFVRTPSMALAATRQALASEGPLATKASRLRSVLRVLEERCDIIHFEWNSAAIAFLPYLRLLNAPIVISCRGTQVFIRPYVTPGYAEQLERSFEAAAAVHCVCDAIKDEATQFGLDPRKAVVIRPAVDLSQFRPVDRREREVLHLVAVGAVIWRKGYEYMLLALRRLLDTGIRARLSIVGSGNEEQRIRFTIHDLGLDPHVTLHGALRPDGVRALLDDADLFVHSSLGEGISNGVLEAMASGLPVVTTDCGGMREAVTDGQEGFVVPMRDVEAMSAALAMLANDAGLRQRMGRAARATVERSFALEQQIASFASLYEELAASRVSR
jgi:colanic acid/amylovoran biosynthesis glycosyltransferase